MKNNFARPKIITSKCLGFEPCRYNGQIIQDEWIKRLKPFVDFFPVCPEIEIGLGVPRHPIRLVVEKNSILLYQPATQKNFTQEMSLFCDQYFSSIQTIDGFILKGASPSCGIKNVKVYQGLNSVSKILKGTGFFGERVLRHFPSYPLEDEGRLTNYAIREHFFSSIFLLAKFQEIKKQKKMQELIQFHEQGKLFFLACHQQKIREAGKIIANHRKNQLKEVFEEYQKILLEILKRIPQQKNLINLLLHAFGGFKDNLDSNEKKFFLNQIEEFRDERIPFSSLSSILQTWAIHYQNNYLLNQTFINPYPKELILISDSGKGRNT